MFFYFKSTLYQKTLLFLQRCCGFFKNIRNYIEKILELCTIESLI